MGCTDLLIKSNSVWDTLGEVVGYQTLLGPVPTWYVVIRRGTTRYDGGTTWYVHHLNPLQRLEWYPLGDSVGLSPVATARLSSALTVEVLTCV